jgi:hypothetical protein
MPPSVGPAQRAVPRSECLDSATDISIDRSIVNTVGNGQDPPNWKHLRDSSTILSQLQVLYVIPHKLLNICRSIAKKRLHHGEMTSILSFVWHNSPLVILDPEMLQHTARPEVARYHPSRMHVVRSQRREMHCETRTI